MSADNGIYVLKTPSKTKAGGCEYRVREVHAVENIYDLRASNGISAKNLVAAFGAAGIVETDEEAFTIAQAMFRQARSEGNIIEHGVLMMELAIAFPGSADAH